MEMEVVDFNFESSCSSPYMTTPSSLQQFGNFYFSAPNSPTHASAFYRKLNNLSLHDVIPRSSASSIPFNLEERLRIPKSKATNNSESDNNNGKIKPLKPPPQLQVVTRANDHSVSVSSPRSPRSRISQGNRMVQEALSPRHKKDFDPFTTTI